MSTVINSVYTKIMKFQFFLASLVCCISLGQRTSAIRCWKKPSCFCYGKKNKLIICKSVEDVSDIRGFLYERRFANTLRIEGSFMTLPSRAFDGFSVSKLVVLAPLVEDIPDDTLTGVINLENVTLNGACFSKIPNAFSNQNLKVFQFTSGLLTGIENQLQNKLSAVKIIFTNNLISAVNPGAFHGTPNVEVLDLSFNKLSYLDPEVFVPLKVLKIINLKYNQLYTVQGCFDGLNPRDIDLYANNLTNVDGAFHRGMWTMRYLNLGANPHLHLTAFSFNESMLSLFDFQLSDNGLTQVDPDLLRFFPKLLRLSLNRNNLTSLPDRFFSHNPSLQKLELDDNRLRSIHGSFQRDHMTYSWVEVALNGNQLESISFSEDFANISSLYLSRNKIRRIQGKDIVSLKKVKFFNLSSNNLQELESGCFGNLHTLRTLDLSDNPLRSLNGSVQNARFLYNIVLRSTSLESLSANELIGAERIKYINVHNNSLSTLYKAFIGLKHITELNISMNNLTTLTEDSFQPAPNQESVRINRLWMANNPWSCDCRLGWIVQWLKRRRTQLKDEPVCSSPDHLRGEKIRVLNETDFERWVDDCPESCDCYCRNSGENLGTEVDCYNRRLEDIPVVLPSNGWSVDLSHNDLAFFNGRSVQDMQELQSLNLEHNKIAKINLNLPSKISSIRLASNQLRTFYQEEWDRLTSLVNITLSQNPWTCNCDTWHFRNWLIIHNNSVLDLLDVRCGPEEDIFLRNKLIISLSKKDLCSMPSASAIVTMSVIGILFIIVFLLCFFWRHTMLAWCYSRGCTYLKTKSTRQDEMPYDVFLLYSAEEQAIAAEIAKCLEDGKYHFRVCVPNRDIPTPRTPEQVSAYLLQCSKVIVLMSRKFLEDDNQTSLLKSNMSFSITSSSLSTIFIMCDKLSQPLEMDPIIRILMRDSVCLMWGKWFFWRKLIYQLPKKKPYASEYSDEEPLL